ncbi:glycosyltransferase family 9 protein [Thermogemmatispora sp.]|uniref:glycosyltransferase family 9 protein n=1 Tax=Thermogemmatispora sp. TaxID=1968838 RepID=UPI001D27ECD9|nr:glycosyltransferase family 9 protein [Thermogemmatispora sp.]MBX5451342.1 glycosyltransferase family 9 protein [Thermogemmatispora sp.]
MQQQQQQRSLSTQPQVEQAQHQQQEPVHLPAEARLLVIKLASIGDLLLATPALRALRETYPQARIDLLVTPASADLLAGWEIIDDIIVLDKYLFDSPQQLLTNPLRLRHLYPLWRRLRSAHYDAVLLLHHLTLPFGRLKHQLLVRATGARWRIGLDNGHGWFLNVRVKDEGFGAMHEADYNLAVAAAVGAHTSDRRLTVPLSEAEREQARYLLYMDEAPDPFTRPIIAMHPGSGSYSTARRWAPERFAALADTLYREVGGQLVLLGGPEERELHQHILSLLRSGLPARSFAGKGSVKVTTAVLEQVDLFIGNDAGVMHLAAAAGTPIVAIFGLSNHRAWGPYTGDVPGRQAIVVRLDLPCMPCFYRGHELGTPEGCATRDCLAQLGVDPVAAAARSLLYQAGYRPMSSSHSTQRGRPSEGEPLTPDRLAD